MKQIQGKSLLVWVSGEFKLLSLRVEVEVIEYWGVQLYVIRSQKWFNL